MQYGVHNKTQDIVKTVIAAIALIFVALCSSRGFAGTTYVVNPDPGVGDFVTMQGCIHGASGGDTCLVDPGMYEEDPDSLGKANRVERAAGTACTANLYGARDGVSIQLLANGGRSCRCG